MRLASLLIAADAPSAAKIPKNYLILGMVYPTPPLYTVAQVVLASYIHAKSNLDREYRDPRRGGRERLTGEPLSSWGIAEGRPG